MRVGGKLTTAARVAWELAHGPLPAGARVNRCPGEPACVRLDHLSLRGGVAPAPPGAALPPPQADRTPHCAACGGGAKQELRPGVWKLTVAVGRDDEGRLERAYRTFAGTEREATEALAAFVAEVGDGASVPSAAQRALTVDDLVGWYLDFARDERGLEHSTRHGYREVYVRWLRPVLGGLKAASLDEGRIDRAFGRMRRAGRKVTVPPELDELLRLLDGADEHDPDFAPVLALGATTGMRRGELCGLEQDRIGSGRCEPTVDRAGDDAGGTVAQKATKPKRIRKVSVDLTTAAVLAGTAPGCRATCRSYVRAAALADAPAAYRRRGVSVRWRALQRA